jgi:hypothetical protein
MTGSFTLSLPRNPGSGALDGAYIPDTWQQGVAPALSAASGTFANGNAITLTGTNFSKKSSTQAFFTDFAADTVGQRASGFTYWSSVIGAEYRVASTDTPPIGSKYMSAHTIQSQFNGIHYELASDTDEIYIEAWCRVNPVTFNQPLWSSGTTYTSGQRASYLHPISGVKNNFIATAAASNVGQPPLDGAGTVNTTYWTALQAPQVKMFRAVDGTGETSSQGRPTNISLILESDGALQVGGVGDSRSCYTTMPGPTVWAKYIMYAKLGTLNVADGKRYTKVNGLANIVNSGMPGGHYASPTGVIPQSAFDGELQATNVTANAGIKFRRVLPPYYNITDEETIVDVSHFYVNTSPERVVIGNASTWAACDHAKTYVCKTTSRLNGQITFTAATSTAMTGALYAYVVNRDGLFNSNGYLVRP